MVSANVRAHLEALFPAISANLRNKVYRHLTVALHPESWGTKQPMKKLIGTYDKFK